MQVYQEPSYILHQRPYRDNSLLIYLLTKHHGKLHAIISGIKNRKENKRAILQPGHRLLIDLQIKTGLSSIRQIEKDDKSRRQLTDKYIFYQYIHELLLTILPEQHPIPLLFEAYENLLTQLDNNLIHTALRQMELSLIDQFANLPDFRYTTDTATTILSDKRYFLHYESGVTEKKVNSDSILIEGAHFMAANNLVAGQSSEILAKGAQPVTTYLLKPLLNHKPLKTRKVFSDLQKYI